MFSQAGNANSMGEHKEMHRNAFSHAGDAFSHAGNANPMGECTGTHFLVLTMAILWVNAQECIFSRWQC